MAQRHLSMREQRGSVAIMVALTLAALLGFAGLVIDLGHLFVTKTEMQSTVDACSLAAAQELDSTTTAITRAQNAGILAGNRNKVNLQSTSPNIVAADITFSETLNGTVVTDPLKAHYAKCQKTSPSISAMFIQQVGGASSNQTKAVAVATRTPAPTICALPVVISPKVGGTSSNKYGFSVGDWIDTVYADTGTSSAVSPGHFGWGNLDSSKSAFELKAEIAGNGYCNAKAGDPINTPGAKFSANVEWNSRFGLYKNGAGNPSISSNPPDFTGYSYYHPYIAPGGNNGANGSQKVNCPAGCGWQSTTGSAYADFKTRRVSFSVYDDTQTGVAVGGFSQSATSAQLQTNGTNRRVVASPLVDPATSKILDFACVLLLDPIYDTGTTVYLEFIGLTSDAGSPCGSTSIAGSTSVVTLVQ